MRQWPKSHDHLEDAVLSRRRLVSVVAITALALIGLSACRSAPGVAAYVGSEKYSDAYVDGLVSGFETDLVAQTRTQAQTQAEQAVKSGQLKPEDVPAQVDKAAEQQQAATRKGFGDLRQTAVRMLVIRDAGKAYAQAHSITIPVADSAAAAAQNNLPPNNELVKLFAEYSSVMTALAGSAKSTPPTEADQREAYDNLAATQGNLPPFDQVKGELTQELMGAAVGTRNLLVEALTTAKASVNPRYAKVTQQIQIPQAGTFLDVPLTSVNSVVSNAPVPTPTANPA